VDRLSCAAPVPGPRRLPAAPGFPLKCLGFLCCPSLLLRSIGEEEALEGSGGAFGDGAEGADEVHVAANLQAFDGDYAHGRKAEFFLDGPFGDEAGAEASFDGGDDGDDRVEVHGDAELAEAKACAAES